MKDGILTTWTRTPQGKREQEIKLDDELDIFGLADIRRAAEGYKVGQIFEGKIFEPNLFAVVPYRVEILDTKAIKMGASEETVFRVKMKMSEIESMSYSLANGDVIRVEGPMGIVMKKETEESAKDMTASENITDLILAFSVDAGRIVENAGSVRRAVMSVTGLNGPLFPGGAQTTASASSTDTGAATIVTVDLDGPKEKVEDLSEYLKPSTHIQSDDPRVIDKAKQIAGAEKNPAKIVAKIFSWVNGNVVKEPAFTLPSTVDVLATMRGDCNEHSALMCGLLRAAGVPTRIAAGLAYMKGKFYYHAWNECYFDGKWIPVDATFGENPAGALRLRISVGELEEQMKIAAVAGKISMRILEAEAP